MTARRCACFLAALLIAAAPLVASAAGPRPRPQDPPTPEPIAGIPVSEYAERRAALMERLDDGPTIILGARSEDFGEAGRFRQRNDFQYLCGIETPGATLLLVPEALDPDGEAAAIVFLPPRQPFRERWDGPMDAPGEATAERYGLDAALNRSELETTLRELDDARDADEPLTVHTHTPGPGLGPLESFRASRFEERLNEWLDEVRIASVSGAIGELRWIKSSSEQERLRAAVAITSDGLREAARVIEPGAFEYTAQGALEGTFLMRGAQRPGFASIVGSGPNSVILHYNKNRREMENGDLVVIDVGAEFDSYTADITRTFPVSGTFTERQREVYELVLEAQRAAEEAFEPGVSRIADLERAARKAMRQSPLRDRNDRSLDRHFIHGLGHWLGMDVHDVGPYDKPIPAGAVFTIEPGIYIPDENLGVRIEDDYLATEDGLVKLSDALPSEPEEIEMLMNIKSHEHATK